MGMRLWHHVVVLNSCARAAARSDVGNAASRETTSNQRARQALREWGHRARDHFARRRASVES
jgi:hypothetical protein